MGIVNKIKKNFWIIKLIFNTSWQVKKRVASGFLHEKQFYEVKQTHTNMKNLLRCTICPNMCRFECPSLRVTQKEMYAPATKSRISYYMERGNLSMNDLHTAEVPYMCTNCDGCRHWCSMDISAGDLLRGVRADLVDREIYIPGVKEFNEKAKNVKTVFTQDTFSHDPSYNVNIENPDVFYFMGCVMAEKKGDAVRANIEILKNAGIKFCTHADERQCCGGPLYTLGFVNTLKEFAKNNLELFKKSGAKTIVSDCPMCAYTIDVIYKEEGFKHNYKVITTSKFFESLIKEGKIKTTESVDLKITFHDPCISARKMHDTTSARNIFSQIPGLAFKEAFLHGEETQCCGRGGVSHIHHPDESDQIGRERSEQMKKTGADIIVSSCPSCEEGFMHNSEMQVMDIGEILVKSLKKE